MRTSNDFLFYLFSSVSIVALQYYKLRFPSSDEKVKSVNYSLYQTPPRNNSDISSNSINRCESDFSLGLERSKSFHKELNELGPLCSTGQLLIQLSKYVAISMSAAYVFIRIMNKNK